MNDVILRNVGYPVPPTFLLSAANAACAEACVDAAGLAAVGKGGAGFNGTDTSSRTAEEVVASKTGWLICNLSAALGVVTTLPLNMTEGTAAGAP